jgi:hypothetical protein
MSVASDSDPLGLSHALSKVFSQSPPRNHRLARTFYYSNPCRRNWLNTAKDHQPSHGGSRLLKFQGPFRLYYRKTYRYRCQQIFSMVWYLDSLDSSLREGRQDSPDSDRFCTRILKDLSPHPVSYSKSAQMSNLATKSASLEIEWKGQHHRIATSLYWKNYGLSWFVSHKHG